VTVVGSSGSVTVGVVKLTGAVVAPKAAVTVIFAGHAIVNVSTGSATVTVKLHDADLVPIGASVAVEVTVVVPIG